MQDSKRNKEYRMPHPNITPRRRLIRSLRRYRRNIRDAIVVTTADAVYEFSGDVDGRRTMHKVGEGRVYTVRNLIVNLGDPLSFEIQVARSVYRRLTSSLVVRITPDPARSA